MHWFLLVGGDCCHLGGQRVHRLKFESCPTSRLGETLDSCFETVYGIRQEYGPPLPEMGTWALGFQVPERNIIDSKIMPLMKRRMDRLEVCVYESFYEDEPHGAILNALSFDKCKSWLETMTEYLLDSEDLDAGNEDEILLYTFSDRPEGFSKPKAPVFTGEVWYYGCFIDSLGSQYLTHTFSQCHIVGAFILLNLYNFAERWALEELYNCFYTRKG
jgi:hypothetical protein